MCGEGTFYWGLMKTKNTPEGLRRCVAGICGLERMKDIHLKIIPQSEHREQYSLGDYWWDDDGVLQVRASAMPDNRMSLLCLLHELVEVMLTEHNGIKEEDIQAWDIAYEKKNPGNTASAGDEEDCPCRDAHLVAEGFERIMANLLGVQWKKYSEAAENI